MIDLANAIYNALLELLKDYRLANSLAPLPLEDDSAEFLEVTEHRISKVLGKLILQRLLGPTLVVEIILRARPITIILNSSFKELLPSV